MEKDEVMSLIDEYMVDCHIMDKTTEPDGLGGVKTKWVQGAPIQAAITFNTSMEARVAEKQGVTSLYQITTKKSIALRYHDVITRDSDNKIFRVTSDGDDNKTPQSAGLNMRVVNAEMLDKIK